MKSHRVIIWTKSISDFLDGNVYGIGVQLYFWAQTFAHHNWEVTTFTFHESFTREGIHFYHSTQWGRLEIIHEWLSVLWNLILIRPQLIIYRGAGRTVLPIALITKLFKIKLILFGASDTDFEKGKELIVGGSHNRRMWQKAVSKTDYIIVQNQYQKDILQYNYGKVGSIIHNIWGKVDLPNLKSSNTKADVVWVANFRKLKRAEWMVNAARSMPEYNFILIGAPTKRDSGYYEDIEQESKKLPNLQFLGKKGFTETNAIISQSKIICCTSVFEGFPNTFLQAWANGVPVISTVNPSELITTHNLGVIVETEEEFRLQIRRLIQDVALYGKIKHCIQNYFSANHAADTNFKKLMDYLD